MVLLGPSQLRQLDRGDWPVSTTRARPTSDLRPQAGLHRHPGQAMTRAAAFVLKYADKGCGMRSTVTASSMCYRYDAQRKKRFKTVELLAAERDWEPPRPRFAHDQIVGLRVAFAEVAVRDRVKQAGGNPERRVWRLRHYHVVALGLNSRIVDEPASNSGCPGSSGENLHADARAPCIHCWMPASRGR